MARLFIITKHATMNRVVIFNEQRLKTGGQHSKVLRIPLNQALMPYTCLMWIGPCSILGYFSNWAPLVGLGPRASHPLCLPPSWWPWLWMPLYGDIFSCQFCVFQSSFDTWFTQQSYLLFLFQANLKNTCKVLLGN